MKLLYILFLLFLISCQSPQPTNVTFGPVTKVADASFRGAAVAYGEAVLAGSPGKVLRFESSTKVWQDITPVGADTLGFRDVEILSADTYLLMGAGDGLKSKIFKTTDKGKTWKVVNQNTFPLGYYNGFDFWDSTTGLLCGDAIDGKLYLLKTKDAGESWHRVGSESLVPFEKGEKGFAASGTGICTIGEGHAWIGTGGPISRAFVSRDFGETWRALETPIRSGNGSSGIFSIDFWDEKSGVFAGGDYKADSAAGNNITLSMGGEMWATPGGSSKVPFRSCVKYLNPKTIMATGTSGTSVSYDEGLTWSAIDVGSFHVFDFDPVAGWGVLADGEGNCRFVFTAKSQRRGGGR